MARPLRLAFAGGVYHVTARGNERKAIARDDLDRTRFVDTLAAVPAWPTVDWLLEQFGGTRRTAQAKYRHFVTEGIRQPLAPWAQVVGQIYLGDEAFVRRAQRASRRMADLEIPRRQRQPAGQRGGTAARPGPALSGPGREIVKCQSQVLTLLIFRAS
jgi:hypothetical protein